MDRFGHRADVVDAGTSGAEAGARLYHGGACIDAPARPFADLVGREESSLDDYFDVVAASGPDVGRHVVPRRGLLATEIETGVDHHVDISRAVAEFSQGFV